ncbi:hypothetical protein ACFSOZ_38655 [Mesorhizobium newzealandense]|uniref:Uncharacterized protein n=1 Tax=Mesorhizobium newzealandense TaxID=1300302 RepID=A0ABW4UQ20_9HYPH
MSANQQSPWERLDAAATDRLIERLLMGVGLAGIVAVVAVAVWLYSGVGFGHWFGYVVAVLVAAGLASIRIGGDRHRPFGDSAGSVPLWRAGVDWRLDFYRPVLVGQTVARNANFGC